MISPTLFLAAVVAVAPPTSYTLLSLDRTSANYLETESIRRSGDIVAAALVQLKAGTDLVLKTKTYNATRLELAYDCRAGASASLSLTFFRPDGTRIDEADTVLPSDWRAVEDGSLNSEIRDIVCAPDPLRNREVRTDLGRLRRAYEQALAAGVVR